METGPEQDLAARWRESRALQQFRPRSTTHRCLRVVTRSIIVLGSGIVALTLASTIQAQQQRLPTLFIIGDSTVKNSGKGLLGWGDPIGNFFDQTRIRIENRARGGRSSRTFFTEGLWEQVFSELKPGDFVLMQFGHNDGGAINDESRARGSLRGAGNETEEIDNLLTRKHEIVRTYGWYLKKFIDDAKAKGATSIVLSPIPRNMWQDGKVIRRSNDYGKWAAEAARAEAVFFIDLNEIVAKQYETIGQEKVKESFFLEDHTHTTPAGAQLNATSIVDGLKALKGCSLVGFLLQRKVQ